MTFKAKRDDLTGGNKNGPTPFFKNNNTADQPMAVNTFRL